MLNGISYMSTDFPFGKAKTNMRYGKNTFTSCLDMNSEYQDILNSYGDWLFERREFRQAAAGALDYDPFFL